MPRALRERGLGFPLEHRNCCQMSQTPRAVCADEVTQYSPHTLPRINLGFIVVGFVSAQTNDTHHALCTDT